MNIFLFIVLPYIALLFLISGLRYDLFFKFNPQSINNESKVVNHKNFFISLPFFYWGIAIILLGHLLAFIFPGFILSWNAKQIRLLIIELGAFSLSLATLFSLILFLRESITQKKLDKNVLIDSLIYILIFVIIISGLWIANFYKWGSSWYSAVLSPYLKSLFYLNPDINAVVEMPVIVKLHIISAFAIAGIISFTRFDIYIINPILIFLNKTKIKAMDFVLMIFFVIALSIAIDIGKHIQDNKNLIKNSLKTTDDKPLITTKINSHE